ncbi:MAG TPA: hypothetical protein VLG13_01755 [Patescibacteria group bacterium]|nr:hypothetical protein [Patescibacteria group bacterium]
MADKSKDVIYIDIDDEITSVIDKVHASQGKIIALVLPKRAAVFQSIVNMKLLKRSADAVKKRLVLITSEAGLLPLAGAVGVHVAKSLQSKPEIPAGPEAVDSEETVNETADMAGGEEITALTAGDKPIGSLAGSAATLPASDDAMETVELDNEEAAADASDGKTTPKHVAKKDSKLHIPNFDRFRLLLALGVLGVVGFIVLLIVLLAVLPKATIAIKTNASNVNTNLNVILDSGASQVDPATNVVPAKQVQEQKTYTQQSSASGQVNKGDKSTGTATMTAQKCSGSGNPEPVPTGTGVSTGGLTYITQNTTTFHITGFSNGCGTFVGDSPTTITAQNGGSKYNVSGASFTVAGRADVSASGSTGGGTDNTVKAITQADIDSAKQRITTQDASVKQDLQNQLTQAGYYVVGATFNAGTPAVTTSANAGDTAENVTVTEAITYTMYGAHQKDLKTLIDNQIKGQIDTKKQSILDDGLATADIKVTASTDKTVTVSLQGTGIVGPDIKISDIKKAVAGKKSGDIKSLIKNDPGVTDVTVKFSPFWVSSAPKNTSKITVTIAKPTVTIKANAKNP